MGFFHKERELKEKPKEDMSKYIAPYQYRDVTMDLLIEICKKLDIDIKLMVEKHGKTKRQHFTDRGILDVYLKELKNNAS